MKIKPFKGLRPIPERVQDVACRPYDVLNSEEAREEASGNPYSFLNVVKPEITLEEDTDHYDQKVYQAARDNFNRLVDDSIFFQDKNACLYIYELEMNGRSQTGIVACSSVDDYMTGKIKKHELTRPDKETDRKNHVRVSMLNAEPVFFAYKAIPALDRLATQVKVNMPTYSFEAIDKVKHRFWVIDDNRIINDIVYEFSKMPATYVADGHHRTAAAALVGHDLKAENPNHTGEEEYNYFLAVHFPDNQLEIIDYNRVVKDLNGHSATSFIEALKKSFDVRKEGLHEYRPAKLHELSMYLEGTWYSLQAKSGTYEDSDPIKALDVTVLSDYILKPVLNIHDLRTDKRIDFVGGIRGLKELSKRVDSGEMKVAFALYPVSMKQLIDIADNDLIMPPKVTWFEPKLRSGLVVHSLEA
ncbi:MAG: DUF1015 family protein [Bacteroidetes bacterium]|nr:DUF1015 family protein [Bacteroidota bacterium]MDA1121480.1 DUF1015 family protein [Bacteroidota bacterium]